MRARDVIVDQSRQIDALRAANADLRRELEAAYRALTRMHACRCITPTEEDPK